MGWSGAREASAQQKSQEQHGLITWPQLLEMGCSLRTVARRVKAKLWNRVRPGVYRLGPSEKSPYHQELMALVLWLGDHAFVSGAAAARLHGFDGMDGDQPLEVSINAPHNGRRPEDVILHRVELDALKRHVTERDGIPVSNEERTLMELAVCWPESEVDMALDSALRTSKVKLSQLRFYLRAPHVRRRRGTRRLMSLVDIHSGQSKDSGQEVRFIQNVVKPFGIETPVHNHTVLNERGEKRKFDYGWPTRGVVVELHSKKAHRSEAQRRNDTEKQNLATQAGLALFIFWYEDIADAPDQIAQKLLDAFQQAADSG